MTNNSQNETIERRRRTSSRSSSATFFLLLLAAAAAVSSSSSSTAGAATNRWCRTCCCEAFQPLLLLPHRRRRVAASGAASFSRRRASSSALLSAAATPSAAASAAASAKGKNGTSSSAPDSWISASLEVEALQRDDEVFVGPDRVLVYDTTLRDGTQGEAVSASADDKLKICRKLSEFDVDYVEAGWPGSNPKDAEFFERAKRELSEQERKKLAAFGSTRRKGVDVGQDKQVQALIDSEAPTVCIVAKAHSWQVLEILKCKDVEENLRMIEDTVSYLEQKGRRVFVDMEHFFDGYAHDSEYSMRCCESAVKAGASALVLCDTNGGAMPWQIADVCRKVVDRFGNQATVGIHCHNDCGMAVANSVTACNNGAGMVQGTVNGIGERTGNADLCSVVPSLALHVNSNMTCNSKLRDLVGLSRYVDEILNRTPRSSSPFVGSSAFAHKGGLHVAAMKRSPLSYQHIDPELVGNKKRVLISELSGRQNILDKIQEANRGEGSGGAEQQKAMSDRAVAILNRVKQLEAKGYTFEGAEASVELMILHSTRGYCAPFEVLDYSANVYDYDMDSARRVVKGQARSSAETAGTALPGDGSSSTARATVKVRTVRTSVELLNGDVAAAEELPYYEDRLEVADGNGPVDALANALVRALSPVHPYLNTVELVDYKVRILDPESATEAATRVMVEFRDSQKRSWTTVSVDTNIISASLNALIDGFEYALVEHADSCMLCEVDYLA